MLAEVLAAAGHHVTWWASGFSHRTKQHRVTAPASITVSERFHIRVVPTTAYQQHISLARIRSEKGYAQGVLRLASGEPAPDVVMLSEPSLFYGKTALRIAKHAGARLVLDTIDLWPELFHIALPRPLRRYGRQLLAPLYGRRARTYARADGIIAVCHEYETLSRRLASHLNESDVQTVYYGVHVDTFRFAMRGAGPVPDVVNIPREPGEIRLVFASTLGSNYDVETILSASAELARRQIPFRLFIAGTGPLEQLVKARAGRDALSRVHFLGNPDAETLARIYARCDIGISAYVAGSSVVMPIKAFHYCAAGLAIVNSLSGELQRLLDDHGAGIGYTAGNFSALVDAITRYVADPQLLARARTASYQLGSEFDVGVQYPRAVQLIERIATRRSRQSGATQP